MIKKIINFLRIGGNFGFVAQNITMIYWIVKNNPFSNALSQKQLLYCVGLIDAMVYLNDGTVGKNDIKACVENSLCDDEIDTLMLFSASIETILFAVDNRLTINEMQKFVLDKLKIIRKAVCSTLKDKKKCILYKDARVIVEHMLNNEEFKNVVLEY